MEDSDEGKASLPVAGAIPGLRPMDKAGFARARVLLGKSQRDLARLLGISLKAVESYEQGWRNVPSNVERMLYFLIFKLNAKSFAQESPCWTATSCSDDMRKECVAYVTGEGHFCWFFTGGLCASAKASGIGERYCYGCKVFSRLSALVGDSAAAKEISEAPGDDWTI
jgi:DNA-binding transcriptional regulator YiaG